MLCVARAREEQGGGATRVDHASNGLGAMCSRVSGPSIGWHHLSNATCLIRPHLFHACLVVSRSTIIHYILLRLRGERDRLRTCPRSQGFSHNTFVLSVCEQSHSLQHVYEVSILETGQAARLSGFRPLKCLFKVETGLASGIRGSRSEASGFELVGN